MIASAAICPNCVLDFEARQLQEVVTVVRGSHEPLSCHDIELICHMSDKQAARQVKRLLRERILERETRTRVTLQGPRQVPTGRVTLSKAYRAGRVEFDHYRIAREAMQGGDRTYTYPAYYLGSNQRAILDALRNGPEHEEYLRDWIVPHLDNFQFKKTMTSLSSKGFIVSDGMGRWRL